MQHSYIGGEAFPLLKVDLQKGESLKAESNAMVAMSSGVDLKGKVDGGIGKAIGRLFSGESFFIQSVEATESDGWVLLATPAPGSIYEIELDGTREWQIEKDGFLAAESGVEVSSKVQSLAKGLFGGEGFFVVKASGAGRLFLSAYGGIYKLSLAAGEDAVVDNGHLVAWPADMPYKLGKAAKGWVSTVTSGEILACRFTGPGDIYIQSRNPRALGQWIFPYIPIPRQT